MKARLEDMKMGWFIGNFSPTLHATEDVEVAVKEYEAGAYEDWHCHKIATEYTVIVSGSVEMNGIRHAKGDIIIVPPTMLAQVGYFISDLIYPFTTVFSTIFKGLIGISNVGNKLSGTSKTPGVF